MPILCTRKLCSWRDFVQYRGISGKLSAYTVDMAYLTEKEFEMEQLDVILRVIELSCAVASVIAARVGKPAWATYLIGLAIWSAI